MVAISFYISETNAQQASNSVNLPAVTVTSTPSRDQAELEMTQPASIVQGDELRRKRRASLGDTLSNELGISSTSFGPAASRPIVRGLGGPRVKVMENSLDSLDLSSVSPDHGVSIESLSASKIEVLRGPATLLYGGNAMGGVVNVVNGNVPERLFKSVNGNMEVRGNTATEERTGAANLSGSFNKLMSWHISGYKRKSNDYDIPGQANKTVSGSEKGILRNSAVDAEGVSLGASLVGARGYLGGSFSRSMNIYGIPSPEGSTINLRQSRFDLAGELDYPFVGADKLKFRARYNDYRHNEIERSGEIGTSFYNRAIESRTELLHKPYHNWQGIFGVQIQYRDFSVLGSEVLVPSTTAYSAGVFLLEEKNWDKWRVEIGGRAEFAKNNPDSDIQSREFNLFSVSMGTTWFFHKDYMLRFSATQGQRAPTTEELYSDGAHPATGTFDIGNISLNRETSHNFDFSLSKQASGIVDWKINVFYNHFSNYIFQNSIDINNDGLADHVDEDGVLALNGDFLVQDFTQTDASFHGIEAEVNLLLMPDNLEMRLFSDYVRGKLIKHGNIPRITPLRFGLELNYNSGPWQGNFRATRVMRQNDVAKLETSTSGYTLLGAEVSYRFHVPIFDHVNFFLQGNNLLNEEIRIHTSFLKNFAPLPGRAIITGFRSEF